MPWTVADVDKHKKGLSDKGKKQWVRIANSVRLKELAKGQSESDAAATAVREANGVVINTNKGIEQYSVYKNKQLSYESKLVVHQDKAHLVVPVVMMVEGVHNGSQGLIYHSIDELGKYPASWNGIPVIVSNHPRNEEGQPISANSPEIIDKMSVGRVYNTNVDGEKLKAEIWFDEDKLNNLCEKILTEVNESKEIEVSLGMFNDLEKIEGEWNGEKYKFVAYNHRPDHLAVLQDAVGACSCKDGCGIGANSVDITELTRTLNNQGFAVNQMKANGEQDLQSIIRAVNDVLYKLDEHTYHYLEELYSDYLIYTESDSEGNKMYKQGYKIESGKVVFVGAPVEVHREVAYVTNEEMLHNSSSINNNKGGHKMPKGNECPSCLKKIDVLIANVQSPFKETDRDWLLAQEESVLDKLSPVIVEKEKIVEKTVEVNKLSTEDQADLAWAKQQREEKRNAMIKSIQDNSEKDAWKPEDFAAMTDIQLVKVVSLIKKEEVVDYSFNGTKRLNINANKQKPLLPTGIKFVESKK